MSRNVFISFLGTSAYREASYQLQGKTIPDVIFVQEALLKLLFSDPTPKDHIFIFLTDEARKKNWGDNGHNDRNTNQPIPSEGLETKLSKTGYHPYTNAIDIPSGVSTKEIWQIFEEVYEQLKEGDRIYLDITHSFRSIPMLSMTLLNYARALKNVELKGIYYGAWEARDENNIAPIFDLTPLDEIQRWSSAVNQFVKFGQVQELKEVMKETYTPRLAKFRGKDIQASRLRELEEKTHELSGAFITNRGKTIEDREFFRNYMKLLKEKPSEEEEWDHFMDPLRKKMIQKIKPFVEDRPEPNWLLGVKWCIDHSLIQQGITQLQEGLVTYIIEQHREYQLNSRKVYDRDFIKKALNLYHARQNPGYVHSNNDWDKFPCDPGEKIISLPIVQKIAGKFCSFSELRNRINHAGTSEDDSNTNKDFLRELRQFYDFVKAQIVKSPTLINLSNHPSDQWRDRQRQQALDITSSIIDLPFPSIPPEASETHLEQLVQSTLEQIMKYNPSHVHIMGEFTFTHRMVQALKAESIICLASTTHRKVDDLPDGSKNVTFDFVNFRKY